MQRSTSITTRGKREAPPTRLKIRYALIITVEAPKHPDLYADILKAYADTLVPIQPEVSLPVRV